jgi:hypothetical protein
MSLQSCEIHNWWILGLAPKNLKEKNNFNVIIMERSKIYYVEEGGGLFLNVGCMNVVNPKLSMIES